MNDSIWVVVNAGGNSRKKEIADEFNAIACLKLTEQRVDDQADILAEGPYRQAKTERPKNGDRMAMLQGGGSRWRNKHGSGEFMACGRISEQARDISSQELGQYHAQRTLVQKYYPPQKPGNKLVGMIFYSIKRARQRLPGEQILVIKKLGDDSVEVAPLRPMPGDKFIETTPTDPGYPILDKWWNDNWRD